MAETCPLCARRKGRRACPAKGETICPQCCGQKRLVLIDCPPDCAYLGGGAPGWSRETEKVKDARRLYPMVESLSDLQAQLLFLGLMGIVALRARHRGLDDRLLASAVLALRKTTETRISGLVYDHPPDDARAQALVRELAALFEAEGDDGRKQAPADRDLLAVLKGLEAGLAVEADDAPTSFLDSVVRLVGRGAAGGAAPSGPARLIS
ncbi:MAG TPA: hypothetical protein VMV21_21595 [Vicinamibacteria bacterium]|nr:hypothetical protein [Vicinamibacteria bacterium]